MPQSHGISPIVLLVLHFFPYSLVIAGETVVALRGALPADIDVDLRLVLHLEVLVPVFT